MVFRNSNQRLNGINPLAYIGDNAYQPPEFVTNTRPPTSTDSSNFELGTIWLNTGNNIPPEAQDIWMLVALLGGSATWVQLSGGMGDVQTLTGNTGGAVGPDGAGNINVVGDATGITIVGNPGTNTLTASLVGGGIAAQSFPTGAGVSTVSGGTAVPTALGVLNILGAHNVDTGAAVANTVTVFGTNTVTLGDLVAIPANTPALTMTTGDIKFLGSVLSATTNQKIVFPSNGDPNIISFLFNNVFIGSGAGNDTMTAGMAIFNIGIGPSALHSLTTGFANVATANGALMNCTTGSSNNAYGYQALSALTTGSNNCAFGGSALASLTTGSYNNVLGNGSTSGYTSSESSNIIIGDLIAGTTGESNVLRIGSGTGTGSAQLNKAFIAGIRGITTGVNDAVAVLVDSANQLGTVSSSKRFKTNIKDMAAESSDILKLRPVTFEYKEHSGIKQYGLIAEEVEEIMPRLVVHDEEGQPLSVKYHEMPSILLNEIIKLRSELNELKQKIH